MRDLFLPGHEGRENFTEEMKSGEKMLILDFGADRVGYNYVPIVQYGA